MMLPLLESDVDPDPFRQFDKWFLEAAAAEIPLYEAMTLSTATPEGVPSSRVVLLKSADPQGFVFYTNYDSRKSIELDRNANASLLFWWPVLERQVRIEGKTSRVTDEESDAYFATRPRGSQIGAWASHQSEVIPNRASLERRVAELESKFAGQAVPRPRNWGGFRLAPTLFEFWQNQMDRLHDRLQYRLTGGTWILERLAP